MPKVPEKTVESFKEYVALVERLQSRAKNSLWFRGCGKGNEGLIPSLYRHKAKKKKADIEELERNLMTRFRQRSIPLVNRPLSDDWETLFFMQHYGIPTRLLEAETKKTRLDQFVRDASRQPKERLELAGRKAVDVLDRMEEIFLPRDFLLSSAGQVPLFYWLVRSR